VTLTYNGKTYSGKVGIRRDPIAPPDGGPGGR
jgi:hypothetical protein